MPVTGNNTVPAFEEQQILSIRLSTDGFSFYIYNPKRADKPFSLAREVNASISLTANLKREFRELEFLNNSYRKVNVVLSGKRFTYVPQELFEQEQADVIFHYNQQHKDNEVVLTNSLKNSNATVLFGIDRSTKMFVDEYFPDARYFAQTALLCDAFSVMSRRTVSRKLCVSLRADGIDIFAFEQGNLLLANTFDISKAADCIYYILATWTRLGFNQQTDELHLSGRGELRAVIMRELKRYIEYVVVTSPETDIDIQELNKDYANY